MPARQIARRAGNLSRKLSFTSYASRAFPRRLRDAASAFQRCASRKTTGGSPSCGMRGTGLRRSARRPSDTGSPRTAGMQNGASSARHPSKAPPISVQSFTLIPFSAPIIPSRFAPRSPVMRHQPIPCFHYSKRHGQILSMPQHSSYESFHKSVHKGFTDSSFCAPYSQFLLKAEYLPHANHHIHHKKTHPCVS